MPNPSIGPQVITDSIRSPAAAGHSSWSTPARTQVAGPETDFVNQAIACYQHSIGNLQVIMREPALPTGYPDIVAVTLHRPTFDFLEDRLLLSTKHFQLLHYLFQSRSATIAAITSDLLWSETAVAQSLADLEAAKMVFRCRDLLACTPISRTFWARRIVAIEAKVSNCGNAIRQAVGNSWYASHSYVLFPESKWRSSLEIAAKSYGIGVMLFNGTRIRIARAPRARSLPSSYGSWLVHEYALRQLPRTSNHD